MPEIAHQSCYSLEEILSFYCRTLSILRDDSVREILSSQPLTVCQILENVTKVLSLFEAALSTYSDVRDSAEEVASRRLCQLERSMISFALRAPFRSEG